MNGDKPPEQEERTPTSEEEMIAEERQAIATARELLQEQGQDEFWTRMFSTDEHLPMVSDIRRAEISRYIGVLWYAEEFGQQWLRNLVDYDLALRVSIDRKGRKEAVTALTGAVETRARSMLPMFRLFRRQG